MKVSCTLLEKKNLWTGLVDGEYLIDFDPSNTHGTFDENKG